MELQLKLNLAHIIYKTSIQYGQLQQAPKQMQSDKHF